MNMKNGVIKIEQTFESKLAEAQTNISKAIHFFEHINEQGKIKNKYILKDIESMIDDLKDILNFTNCISFLNCQEK
jgi:uncharacterized protein YjgD (DUF1641 family)